MAKQYSIKVTLLLENNLWVGIFERNDDEGYAVARNIFGKEPTDAELYQFVLSHLDELKFTEAHDVNLVIKRKNYKRVQREVRHELESMKKGLLKTTHAQEVLRLDLEKNKKLRKTLSKDKKLAQLEEKYQQKQAKRKQKQRGH